MAWVGWPGGTCGGQGSDPSSVVVPGALATGSRVAGCDDSMGALELEAVEDEAVAVDVLGGGEGRLPGGDGVASARVRWLVGGGSFVSAGTVGPDVAPPGVAVVAALSSCWEAAPAGRESAWSWTGSAEPRHTIPIAATARPRTASAMGTLILVQAGSSSGDSWSTPAAMWRGRVEMAWSGISSSGEYQRRLAACHQPRGGSPRRHVRSAPSHQRVCESILRHYREGERRGD